MTREPSPSQRRVVSAMAEAGRPVRAVEFPGADDFRVLGGIARTLQWMVREHLAVAIPVSDPPGTAYELTEQGMQWYDKFGPKS